MLMTSRSWLLPALVLAGSLAHGGRAVEGQTASAPELKAAYLLNFIRFTTWPEASLSLGDAFVACVSGDAFVATAIGELVRGRRVAGRDVTVRRLGRGNPVDGCHLLYWSATDGKHAGDLLRQASARPILTVGESPDSEPGGIASFFVDQGRMRFAFNPAAAERAQLQISSKLLSLATIVKDAHAVAR